ncbi:hypothetical protein COW86_02640 [Candidatus Kuenenbacteria bacterium CG22_combo_CG10-13_8_21_14_all_39_9]|uniref:Uncharacterized protein n=1 Tax=Candidatus Kuenenbacteria bacterium CG22_combo_CG10-13_8_21_14_all_39_9 TaxID=1974621 RepID=A0A2H0D0V5_9BACT|nr:MAG: hypothetical protein COW86_02640 [Candidatus Kuenenbacteria bacterium CG22_combo_CG10-13_8_21_14_all_39_9]
MKEQKPKKEKFDFEAMKAVASSKNPTVRKLAFVEYFDRFGEFPSYLFDNERKIDENLLATMEDLRKDPETTKEMHQGIEALLTRLPS